MKAGRKAVNEFISPNLMTVDLTSDMMVQHDQFSIYFKCRPVLRLLYLLFDFIDEIDIFAAVNQHITISLQILLLICSVAWLLLG